MSFALLRLGRWCARHRRGVVAVWVVLLIGLVVLSRLAGSAYDDYLRLPGSESQQAYDTLRERFPAASGASARLVMEAPEGVDLKGPAGQAPLGATIQAVMALPHVVGAEPMVSPSAPNIALVGVGYDQPADSLSSGDVDALLAAGQPARDAGLRTVAGGELVEAHQDVSTSAAELAGLAMAVIILLVTFGSVLAMLLPIGLALAGLGVGTSLLALSSWVVDSSSVTPVLATMIGIGVGIDYALLLITRHRQHMAEGMDVTDSIGRAVATSGQAVVFAGGTVVVAICGLAIAGIPMITMMGLASALVVAIMVVATVTLLPALLGFVGHNIDRLRIFRLRQGGAPSQSVWARWGTAVARHPWPYLLVGTAVLLAMAAPALSLRLGQPDAGTDPPGFMTRQAYDLVAEGFGPGFNGPLLMVATTGNEATLGALAAEVAATPGVVAVMPPQVSPDGGTAVLTAIPATAPQDPATTDLLERLRGDVLADQPTVVFVGGPTASFVDLGDQVAQRLPWFIGAILVVSFLLLMVVFRSILVPLKAALMNLLSIAAAYGVVVAVFQWGWLGGLFGLEHTVPIASVVPMMMFAILFGLSMDYEVFLLSRVREEYVRTGDTTASVVSGISSTARVITSAALIMIAVFGSFVLAEDPIVKMMGLGLATAILVDATVVRIVLVPASMRLLGDVNWWLPRWLDRILPRIDVESSGGGPHPEDAGAALQQETAGVL